MAPLTQVDNLEFLVLVDNCVEWISTLPPGFSHEMPQHLNDPEVTYDELTGLPVAKFDDFCCGAHGLSILITTTIGDKKFRVLYDTGPEPLSIDRNVKAMKVKLTELDALFLSHWHRDHSGGILRALELRNEQAKAEGRTLTPLTVDLHPDRPIRRGIAPLPKRIPTANFLPDPSFDEIAAANGVADLHAEAHEIQVNGSTSGIGVSGEIPRVQPFERGLPGAVTWMADGGDEPGQGGWCTDELIKDERYVVIDVKGKGLVIFSACSHAGVCNVVTDAVKEYGRPVHMVVGGFHLVPVEQQPVKETVDFLARRLQPRPEYVLPLHCTGLAPRAALRNALGDACIAAGVGMKVVVTGDEAAEAALDAVEPKVIA
ncbi:hypothetical protein Q8F55_002601 [Vanrija albida]|uniref:Metallo-beta-lactamase domain-containing protein n=1 Tax=Vanrija albida TaxID=181172 RepID=A0ABR3QAU4_9TREE